MKALLFDMDGVLVNSEDYWHEFEDDLLGDVVAGDPPDLDEITGMPYREIYDYLAETSGVRIAKDEFVARYDEAAKTVYGERVSLLPGFRDLQADLLGRGVDVGLVSSSPHAWIDIVLERFTLSFNGVWSADDVDAPGKPEPHVYRHAAAELGVAPADCVVVEDSTNGALAGHRAGMTVVGYRTTHNRDSDLSAADVVVDGPEELREELLNRASA